MQEMTIGQLADAAGVGVETVRYYHRRGLLPLPDRPDRGIRRYPPGALTRLRFVRRAQSLGFSLDDVATLLPLDDGHACGRAKAIGEHKLGEVRQRIETLRTLEAALQDLVRRCSTPGRGRRQCPLIDALMQAEGGD